MVGVRVICIMGGTNFSPSVAEASTGLAFQHKNEPGEAGIDRVSGKASHLGHAELTLQEFGSLAELGAREGTVLSALGRSLEALRRAGATEIRIKIDIEYAGQCQIELPPELLRRLADLVIPVTISAYPTDETEDLAARGAF